MTLHHCTVLCFMAVFTSAELRQGTTTRLQRQPGRFCKLNVTLQVCITVFITV